MLFAALITAFLLDGGQSVRVIAEAPPPAETARAGAAAGTEVETQRVCGYERATGSNRQRRVCRDVPVYQDHETREFIRNHQRVRLPDAGATGTPAGPGG